MSIIVLFFSQVGFKQKDKLDGNRKDKDEDIRDGEIMEEIVRELRESG